jgi:hypothetical protein
VLLVEQNFDLPKLDIFNHTHNTGNGEDLVEDLITCLNKFIAASMQRVINEETLKRVDIAAKLYLSAVHDLDFFLNGHIEGYKPEFNVHVKIHTRRALRRIMKLNNIFY